MDHHPHADLRRDFRLGLLALRARTRSRPLLLPKCSSLESSGCGTSSIPKAFARSTSFTSRWSADQAHDDVRRRDSRLLYSGLPREERRHARPLSSLWFEATENGTFHLFCAQYCGTDHSEMIGWVYVMSPQDYANWLAGERRAPLRWRRTASVSSINWAAPAAMPPTIPAADRRSWESTETEQRMKTGDLTPRR